MKHALLVSLILAAGLTACTRDDNASTLEGRTGAAGSAGTSTVPSAGSAGDSAGHAAGSVAGTDSSGVSVSDSVREAERKAREARNNLQAPAAGATDAPRQ